MTNNTDTLVAFAATSGATHFWTGIDAAGHVAQFWTKEPDPANYPRLAIAAHVILPLGAAGDAAGWEPVGAAPALPAAAPVPESQPADERDRFETWLRAAGRLHESDLGHGKVFLDEQKAEFLWQAFQAGAALSAPAAAPVAADAGWMTNTGTKPVADDVRVAVTFVDGDFDCEPAGNFDWGIEGDGSDIAMYFVVPAAPATSDKAEG